MGVKRKRRTLGLLWRCVILSLLIVDISCFGATAYVHSIEAVAQPQEVLSFSIHELYADHFRRNPVSDDVFLSSAHSAEGYVSIDNRTDKRLCINLIPDSGKTLVYTAMPGVTYCLLTEGPGDYEVICGEEGKQALLGDAVYTQAEKDVVYTYPSSYVMFSPDSDIVKFCSTLPKDEVEYINAVFSVLAEKGEYTLEGDRDETWYVPDPNRFVKDFRGDCFDFASFATAALRLRGIPCKLVVGDVDGNGHAWIELKPNFSGNVGGFDMKKGKWSFVDPTVFVTNDLGYGELSFLVPAYYEENKDKYTVNYTY